ncbi:MAG: FecR domain-containing protein, partial [Limisphaerales bacterium]
MRKTQISVACALALAFVGVATLKSAEDSGMQSKATVRAIHGNVEEQVAGTWMPLKINADLDPGTVIRTGPDSTADISVNGLSSALRVEPESTVTLQTMTRTDSSRDADSDTFMDLQDGAILGNVKKISANSRYEIKTPHGVAGIRGSDYHVRAMMRSVGRGAVRFASLWGQ